MNGHHFTRADALTGRHTSFGVGAQRPGDAFAALLFARNGYRPTFIVDSNELREITDLYDAAQNERRDPRRAHRIDPMAVAA